MRVVPARAGVIRGPATGLTSMRCRPRASGGHPPGIVIPDGASASSPRERGSSPARQAVVARMGVVPARAGVIRATTRRRPRPTSRPRASGGHPANGGTGRAITKSSPRERGSSPPRGGSAGSGHVVPARAGVILPRGTPARRGRSRPRASGGHPRAATTGPANIMSSPRERGSSVVRPHAAGGRGVVPARAGVIRCGRMGPPRFVRRPRASGGHPQSAAHGSGSRRSSPRERGSSVPPHPDVCDLIVVPARAGVIRPRASPRPMTRSRPRASGGHPSSRNPCTPRPESSPRERGSSATHPCLARAGRVVPARAGVIRWLGRATRPPSCRPRASGGHPSPGGIAFGHMDVVPARAGVIRGGPCPGCPSIRRPRASGGHPTIRVRSR